MRDLDGSLTGTPNAVIVHANEFNSYRGCRLKSDWNAHICFGHTWGMVRITNDRNTSPLVGQLQTLSLEEAQQVPCLKCQHGSRG